MSPVILNKRKSYYEILEATQKGDSNITAWFVWFLQALNESLDQTLKRIEMTLLKSKFWQAFQTWIYMRDSAKFKIGCLMVEKMALSMESVLHNIRK